MSIFLTLCIRHKVGTSAFQASLTCTPPPHLKPANDHEATDGVPRQTLSSLAHIGPGDFGTRRPVDSPLSSASAAVGVETAKCDEDAQALCSG